MENEKSYTELMKTSAMDKKSRKEKYVVDIFIDMILNEANWNRQKAILQEKIDNALDHRDKDNFILLTKELVELNKRYGT